MGLANMMELPMDRPLEQREERFDSVRMMEAASPDILVSRVIDGPLAGELAAQPLIYRSLPPIRPSDLCAETTVARKIYAESRYPRAKPLGGEGWRGDAQPYPGLGEGGATQSEIGLENGTLPAE